MKYRSRNKPSTLQQKSRQFIDERVELLNTIREMVGQEIDKRMECIERIEKTKRENLGAPS